uniref:Uncharacterized protein n=1 Tax=Trichuris muris TaxID=70415 RepID=A0A5S6R1L0_TRIMR
MTNDFTKLFGLKIACNSNDCLLWAWRKVGLACSAALIGGDGTQCGLSQTFLTGQSLQEEQLERFELLLHGRMVRVYLSSLLDAYLFADGATTSIRNSKRIAVETLQQKSNHVVQKQQL